MTKLQVNDAEPVSHGLYQTAVRHGDLIFTAGMTPRLNGRLEFEGPVASGSEPTEYQSAVVLACGNALSAARSKLVMGETLSAIVSMTVYIAAEPSFTAHSKLADFASDMLRAEFGTQALGVRASVGVATLPGNAPVEIQLIAAACERRA
jgi:enamine deaminase RidA (YjgF/YER057c/UK114 family)